MDKSSLGDRMKGYEAVATHKFIKRMPLVIRLDGKAFHSLLRPLKNRTKSDPWDSDYHETMVNTTIHLANNIQNVILAYSQSDEITLVLKDWAELTSQQWFDGKQSKIESVAASMATGAFNKYADKSGLMDNLNHDFAMFDARAFNVPKEDVLNNVLWRQQDATRNSVQMLGHFHFSHTELQNKNVSQIQDMLMLTHQVNWNDLEVWKRRGFCVHRRISSDDSELLSGFALDEEMPILTQDRNYIERFLG
jgi:tRNA(His) 5'-end guanylyltransferase